MFWKFELLADGRQAYRYVEPLVVVVPEIFGSTSKGLSMLLPALDSGCIGVETPYV